jgi:hypothetical protein
MAEGLEPILILTIEADHALRADQVAKIINRLAGQFDSYQGRKRESEGSSTLRLHDLRTGSIVAKLIAIAEAANTIAENSDIIVSTRDVLAGFYNQLFDAWQLLANRSGRRVSANDRRTIEILAAPVANDNARQVCLQLFGENNRIIVISTDDLDHIIVDGPELIASDFETLSNITPEERTQEERIVQILRSDNLSPVGVEYITSHRPGILVSVKGEWYVRYQGGEGAMVPLRRSKFDKSVLEEDERYLVDGRLLKSGGSVTGYEADTIEPMVGDA